MALTERECEAADKFASAHYARQCRSRWTRKKLGSARMTLHLTQTGIGYHVEVECPNCKERNDITDYDSW